MTELNNEVVTKTETPSINMDELKEEIKNQNISLLNTVLSKINEKKEMVEDESKGVSFDAALEEFKDDLKDLRVDDEQAKALLRIFNKVLAKENPKVKNEIISEVKSGNKFEKDKELAETEIATLYPDIVNKKSALFKESVTQYAKLSDAVKNSVEGTSTAIMKAAAVLGIAPVDLKMVRSMHAMGPSGGGKPQVDEKVTQKAVDFAASFGVKKDAFEEKLKEIKAKSR